MQGDDGYPIGIDLLGMYVHGDRSRLEHLRPQIRLIADNISARPKHPRSQMADHHFGELMTWILAKGRGDADASAVALSVARQLAAVDADHHEDFIKPLLPKLLSDFPEIVWPLIGGSIVSDRKEAWRLEQLLGDTFTFGREKIPPLLLLPTDVLFAWCHAQPDVAPAFVAAIIPVLTNRDPHSERALHPIMHRLLDEFGARADVLRALNRNMYSFGWSGSRATYFMLYDGPLSCLETHQFGPVRRWAKKTRLQLRRAAEEARNEDDERDLFWGD
jgi:hypothetical protein